MVVTVVLAFAAGLLTFLAPCTLPILPLFLGASVRGGGARTLGVILGFATAFVITSVVLTSALSASGLSGALRLLACGALALAGAAMAFPTLPSISARLASRGPAPAPRSLGSGSRAADRSSLSELGRGVAMGASIGLVWSPCVGPVVAGVLALAATAGPTADGLAIASSYALGAAIALAAVAVLGGSLTRRLRPGPVARLRRGLGVVMVVVAVSVASGLDVQVVSGLTARVAVAAGQPSASPADPSADTSTGAIAMSSILPAERLSDLGPAPELTGITAWLNSDPLTLAGLRGKVVLVHFWTFGCINCINVQPYVKAWYQRYADQGFVVIGVHTPELSFERDIANVRRAVADDGVAFPVAFDPAFATWNAYRNTYWPAFYFVDKRGNIRFATAGEGDYDTREAVIRTLLAEPG